MDGDARVTGGVSAAVDSAFLTSVRAGDIVDVTWVWKGGKTEYRARVTGISRRETSEVARWTFDVMYIKYDAQMKAVEERDVRPDRLRPMRGPMPWETQPQVQPQTQMQMHSAAFPSGHAALADVVSTGAAALVTPPRVNRKRPRPESAAASSATPTVPKRGRYDFSWQFMDPREPTEQMILAACALVGQRIRHQEQIKTGAGKLLTRSGVIDSLYRVGSNAHFTFYRVLFDNGDEAIRSYEQLNGSLIVEPRLRSSAPAPLRLDFQASLEMDPTRGSQKMPPPGALSSLEDVLTEFVEVDAENGHLATQLGKLRSGVEQFVHLSAATAEGLPKPPAPLAESAAANLHSTVAAALAALGAEKKGSVLDQLREACDTERDRAVMFQTVIDSVANGVLAAVVLILLWSSPLLDRRLMREDYLVSIFELTRSTTKRVIMPCCSDKQKSATPKKRRRAEPKEEADSASLPSRADASRSGVRLAVHVHTLLEKFLGLLPLVRFESNDMMSLCSIAKEILMMDSRVVKIGKLSALQHCAICVYETVFVRQLSMRSFLVQDVFAIMMQLSWSSARKPSSSAARLSIPSRLILTLVQTAASLEMPTPNRGASKALGSPQAAPSPTSRSARSSSEGKTDYTTAIQIAQYFVAQLLLRCKKKEGGSDWRQALSAVVSEWLESVGTPEWPAVQTLVQSTAVGLMSELCAHLAAVNPGEASTPTPATSALDPQFVFLAVEVYGRITAHVVGMASAAPEPSSPKLPGPVIDAVMRTIRILRSSADEEKRLSQVSPTAKVRETPLKGHALLRQALALYLVEEGLPEHSRKFRLAEWMHNWSSLSDTDYDAPEVYLAQWDVPEHVQHACFPALPRHVLDQLGRGCLLDGGLIGAKEKLQTRLLDLLRAPLVGVRSRALKALSVVIEKDPSLMLQPAIAHAVESSLSDEAISVRQAVVDLVGKYSLGSMECFDVYRTSLLDRIIDKGVSVRKSVVKILQGVLLKFPAYPKRVLLCTALVKSLNMRREEDSVKELVSSIFAKIWFDNAIEGGADVPELVQDEKSSENGQSGETGENGQNGQNGEEASQPSLDSATKVRRRKRSSSGASLSRKRDQANARHLKHIAEQIVEVVAMQNCEPVWLVGLVGELLNGPGEGDEGKKDVRERARRVKTRCEELTSHLMELVASVESGGEALDALKEISPAQQLLAVLETLCVLSNAAPSSLIPHLASFWPYLKADNGFDAHTEGRLCELICNMVCSALLHAGNDVLGLDEGTLADVNSDLRALALRFGTATVTASVHAMCVIAIYTQKPTALVRIGSPFHAKISAILQGPVDKPYQPREAQFVERGLVILGALVRFWHGHVRRAKGGSLEGLDTAALSTKQSAWLEKLPTLLANALPKLLRRCSPHGHRNRGVRLRIVSALTALFIGNPAEVLRLHNDGLLQGLLRDEDLEIVTSSVRLLREALDEEESRVESGIARQQMTVKTESGTMQVAHQVRGDQDSEASICGGIAAMLMSEIRSHLYGQDVQLRYESLCLQGTLLRQGLQNPNDCIKSLVVLQADQCVPVRSEALRQLLLEYEKHPSFLLVHFVGGVAKSMGFQQTVFGELCAIRSDSSEENGGVESVFGRVYSMCIRGSRKHRQSTLTKLLKLVVAPAERCERRSAQVVANAADPSAEAEPPSFQRFLAEVLAYLPYVQHDEVLFVLYSTSHLISQYAHHVLEGAVDQLQKVGLAGDSIEEMTAPSDDMPAADLPAASLHAFQKLVRGATCMKLLVGLFKFLKGYYGVTHGRLEKYHPSQSVRKYQTGVSRADTSSSFREVLRTLLPNGSVDEAEELMRAFSVPLFMTYLQGLQDLLDREATTIVDEDVEVMDTPKSNASPSRPKRARRTQRVTVEVESDGYFSCADDEDCEADEEDDEQDSASVV